MRKSPKLTHCMDRSLRRLSQQSEAERHYPITPEDLLHIPRCPLCGSGSLLPIAEVWLQDALNFFNTSVCLECSHNFRSLTPGWQWFKDRWRQIATGSPGPFNPEIEETRKERYRTYLEWMKPFISGRRVLEIGAAFGSGISVFQEAGFEVEAIEPEDARAEYLRRTANINVHAKVIEEITTFVEPFDLIVFAHALEHMDDQARIFQRVRQWLKPNTGVLYLEVPFIWEYVTWSDAFFLAHKCNFNEENLYRLAASNGLRVAGKRYPRQTPSDPRDIAMVLCQGKGPTIPCDTDENRGATEVRALFQRGLETMPLSDGEWPIRYSVPYINHFYYSVRIDEGTFIDKRKEKGFIEFVPTAKNQT
ncbi:MAG: class I SAM-dependent methyltransferase [Alphaproteobacteria bacterium]